MDPNDHLQVQQTCLRADTLGESEGRVKPDQSQFTRAFAHSFNLRNGVTLMSTATANPALTLSRLGQQDKAGSVLANFEDVLLGEVIAAYETKVTLEGRTRSRNIMHGKSATFDAVYIAATEYFTAGSEITGGDIAHNQINIPVDDLLIAPVMIFDLDEAMNHYDVRGPYSTELGRAQAVAKDKNIARNLVRAARSSAIFTGDTAGQNIIDADGRTSGSSLAGSVFAGKQALEEADVPVDSVPLTFAVKAAQWYLLAQETTLVLNRDIGGEGSYAKGILPTIAAVDIVKSNAYPWATNDSANTAIPSDYRVDMTNTIGVLFTEAAVGTVNLMGMQIQSEDSVSKQGTLVVARQACGHGPIIPKAAVEFKTA